MNLKIKIEILNSLPISYRVLESMRRGYTRESYLSLVDRVREIIPGVTLSTDMIAGFCGETEEDFKETVSLIRRVKYHQMFMFPYSLREVRLLSAGFWFEGGLILCVRRRQFSDKPNL